MITFIIIGLVISLFVLELVSYKHSCTRLRFTYNLDMKLCEPDEIVTMRYSIINTGRLPIMFAGVSVFFPEGITIQEDPAWMENNVTSLMSGHNVNITASLKGRSKHTGTIRFSVSKRGLYSMGKHFLEGGDIIGLKDKVVSFPSKGYIVCTARPCEDDIQAKALGNVMGDISVRRFIHEDPTLLLGYREYTGLEPMKSISWTQTAKTGSLMVRKNDFTIDVDVNILVNLTSCSKAQAELSLSRLRTVCETLEENHISYSVISNGDLKTIARGMGRAHLYDVLYRIGTSVFAGFIPFEDIVDSLIQDNQQTSGYVLITPHYDESIETLVRKLDMLTYGKTIVLSADEPIVEEQRQEAAK